MESARSTPPPERRDAPKPPPLSTAIVAAAPPAGPLATVAERVAEEVAYKDELKIKARAAATLVTYATAWRSFEEYCAERGVEALPSTDERVATYLGFLDKKGKRIATIGKALAAIAHYHRAGGFTWRKGCQPEVATVMQGMKRRDAELGRKPVKKAAFSDEEHARMVAKCGDDLRGLRDRAILSLGWMGAFRRSELVALDVADLVVEERGPHGEPARYVAEVRRSKTDQEGHGQVKAIVRHRDARVCPVRWLGEWLNASGITEGPIFRTVNRRGELVAGDRLDGYTIATIVKRAVTSIGLDPTRYGAHSLRASFISSAHKKGASFHAIKRQTGHKSDAVLEGYIRHADAFEDNAAVDKFGA